MLQSIILFLALYFSWSLFSNMKKPNINNEDVWVDQLMRVITFFLWACLFYLLKF